MTLFFNTYTDFLGGKCKIFNIFLVLPTSTNRKEANVKGKRDFLHLSNLRLLTNQLYIEDKW